MTGWVGDLEAITLDNTTFRTLLFTGAHQQLTVMCLQPSEEIGVEMHDHLDPFIRVETGRLRSRSVRAQPRLRPRTRSLTTGR